MLWRLILDKKLEPERNMAIDEAVLRHVSRGLAPPTIRFYGWDPPGLSLGRFQEYGKAVNEEALASFRGRVVRRPTGGRAVLHDDELTYAVVAPVSLVGGGVLESYRRISEGLILGLRALGYEVSMERSKERKGGSAACFDAPSLCEVVCGGRKLVGSAQTRRDRAFLQHGSIPLQLSRKEVAALMAPPGKAPAVERALGLGAVALAEAGKRPDEKELIEALCRGLEESLGMELVAGALTPGEVRTARELERVKYSSREWNRGGVEDQLEERCDGDAATV